MHTARAEYVRGGLTRHLMHITQCATVRLVRRLVGAPSNPYLNPNPNPNPKQVHLLPVRRGALLAARRDPTRQRQGGDGAAPQPYVPVAATLCASGCNPLCRELQLP